MIYLFILIFSTINFYALERLVPSNKRLVFFIAALPVLFVLILFPSLQLGVGSDYFTYMAIYNGNSTELERFFLRGEYLFYYIFKAVIDLNLGEQAIFFVSTTFNMTMLLISIVMLRRSSYKSWVVFFLFLVVTNIYHNQMNGLRQYMGLMLFPLLFISLIEKKFFVYFSLIILASFFHKTALVGILMFPALFLLRFNNNKKLVLFILIPMILLFVKPLIMFFVENYFRVYAHYLTNDYGAALDASAMLTKLYYLPAFIYFWFLYLKKTEVRTLKGMDLGIAIWLSTYWLFILYLDFGFIYRIASYFFFFYIFPLYYVFENLIFQRKLLSLTVFILYIIFPYFLKVTYLAKGVFLYESILF